MVTIGGGRSLRRTLPWWRSCSQSLWRTLLRRHSGDRSGVVLQRSTEHQDFGEFIISLLIPQSIY
ncbi:hypothetical protein M6B38_106065 [Iris pallida]|uniref:Uncharacterized protein n=1 Tax=Iris pallida TaxID=29817 RepID=A0AAX6ES29_IRIPA|nr:hypothetical protein M6B38_106065 [Iris pallida]